MNIKDYFIELPTPLNIEEVVTTHPDLDKSLPWGIQTMNRATLNGLLRAATAMSDEFRYALMVPVTTAQYLCDLPEGALTEASDFVRCDQNESHFGYFCTLPIHVAQQSYNEYDRAYMTLLILNQDGLVVGYTTTLIRGEADHIVNNNVLPRK